VSAAFRPDFYGETLPPRTGTGTVPQLAGETPALRWDGFSPAQRIFEKRSLSSGGG